MSGPKTSIDRRIRAANYLSVAQIYLKDNFLLERPLESNDIKDRLLGHWGTCPGINLVYANLKAYYGNNFNFILGPGHGFPALQANLFIDGDLENPDQTEISPQNVPRTRAGLEFLCGKFSQHGGFPSHASPLTPKVIYEGGELGYSLATAYGAALTSPQKQVVLLGDGEFETATALTSLNLGRLLNRRSVLPILHLNGYKISAATIYGRKSDRELSQLLRGFGYEPIFLDHPTSEQFQDTLAELETKNSPFLIVKTDKGATGPIQGYQAHQVPLKNPKTDEQELKALESWLKSYKFNELYDPQKGFQL